MQRSPNSSAKTPSSLETLSRNYYAVLVRYFFRRGIAEADAQDLAQEVFERLVRRKTFSGISNVEGYLFATASNTVAQHFRYKKVRTTNPVEDFYEEVQCTGDFSPRRVLEGRQELELILGALNEMPERMRNIFVLARLENIPRSEIAIRLGVSKSLVEQQITHATACLADRRSRIT